MNQNKIRLVAFSFILAFVFSNHSLATDKIITHPNSEELLDELNIVRDLKQKKHDHFEINKWKPGFRKLLEENGEKWSTVHRQAKDSLEEYLSKLTSAYINLPESHPSCQNVKSELLSQHPKYNKKKLTESYKNHLTLLANTFHNELIKEKISQKKASFLADLIKPTGSIKFEDRMRLIGITVEPQSWIIQAAYSLAQLRAGNISTARKENVKLLRKSEKLSKKGNGINYRKEGDVRTYQSLYREYLLHRALIESHAKEKGLAKKYLTRSLKIEEDKEIKSEQNLIIREINSLSKS
jgi:hypothetical protein